MEPKKSASPASSPAAGKGVEVKPGVIAKPLTPDSLHRLGFELYGAADCSALRLFETRDGFSIEFWFPTSTPPVGRTAGLQTRFKSVPGNLYYLQAEIFNGYAESRYPRRIVQKVAVEGMTVDVRDIAQSPHRDWRRIEYPFTALGSETEVAIYLEVVGDLEPWNWGYACRAMLRKIHLRAAWDE